jgi:hypothetical protein
MTSSPCPRLFEAEAMRDGRLTGAGRASFERHMGSCAECTREVQALGALAEALRASAEDANELHVRRERTRLLTAFDHALVAPARRWGGWASVLFPTFAAVLALGVVAFLRARPPAPSQAGPRATVHAESAAEWSMRTEGDHERLILVRGALWIHVEHPSGAGHFVVQLPDGELEDTGTTFTVSADEGHTTRVAVQEGSVVLRLHDEPAVPIGPGDVWVPTAPPAVVACPSAAAPTPAGSSVRAPAVTVVASPRPTVAPTSSAEAPDPTIEFRAAMAALEGGDNAAAAAGFARFVTEHPRAPQVEDATYLRVIALQRSGDDGATKQAAREYLGRYSAGFRRAEVEALAR